MSAECCNCDFKNWQRLYADLSSIRDQLMYLPLNIWRVRYEKTENGHHKCDVLKGIELRAWKKKATPQLKVLYDSAQLQAKRCDINMQDIDHLRVCDIVSRKKLATAIANLRATEFSFDIFELYNQIQAVLKHLRSVCVQMNETMRKMQLNSIKHEASHYRACRDRPYIAPQNKYMISF